MQRNKNEVVGTLDEVIVIQRATTVENEYSEKVQTWADLETTWAAVNYPITKSDEMFQDGLNIATRSVIFEIRETDVTVSDRIVFDSKYFDVNTIEKNRLSGRWKLHCQSSV